jgi:hypothetical protein
MTKNTFLKKLKDSPYSDKLIGKWMKTFSDDSMSSQYLQAIELNNRQWLSYKKDGISVEEYNDCVYKHYKNEQDIPHNLIIPIFLGSCDEISNSFLAKEFVKNLSVITF